MELAETRTTVPRTLMVSIVMIMLGMRTRIGAVTQLRMMITNLQQRKCVVRAEEVLERQAHRHLLRHLPPPRETCRNTDNGEVDSSGDPCTWYDDVNNQWQCGYHDDDNFRANEMCCACGGGTGTSEPYCPPFETGEDLKEAITMYIDTPVDSRDDPNVNPCGSIELWYVVFERTCRSMA